MLSTQESGISALTVPTPPLLSTPRAPVAELLDAPDSKSEIAEDCYLELRGKARAGALPFGGPTFKKAADQFLAEYETITQGQRNPTWVKSYEWMLRVYLVPYFGKMALSEVTAGKIQEYRIYRRQLGPDEAGRLEFRDRRTMLRRERNTRETAPAEP